MPTASRSLSPTTCVQTSMVMHLQEGEQGPAGVPGEAP